MLLARRYNHAGIGEEGEAMQTQWRSLAEQLVHARPTTDEDAKHALEWIATRQGKTLGELVDELRARGERVSAAIS
jgi:hypothetical protein